jgi:hypothetical protein
MRSREVHDLAVRIATGLRRHGWEGHRHGVLSPEDFAPMYAFMESWNDELIESGELVDAQSLAAPVHARRIQLEGGVPVVTDGPYAETEEVLAGYTLVECGSFDRATEIAARVADCPYPGGLRGVSEGPAPSPRRSRPGP